MVIDGEKILNLPFKDVEISKEGYKINTNETIFIVNTIENTSMELISQLMSCEWKYQKYLHCIDDKGIKFTLFDCKIAVMNYPTLQLKIFWEKMVYGEHYIDDVNLKANYASFLIESDASNKPIKFFIEKTKMQLEHCCVESDWKTNIAGIPVEIIITSFDFLQLSFFDDVFLKVMEIYYLYLGFFCHNIGSKIFIRRW